MSSLFMPKDQYDMDLANWDRDTSLDDMIMVYGSGKSVYALESFNPDNEPVLINELDGAFVIALALHNEELYAGNNSGEVRKVMSNEKVADRNSPIFALESHDGVLYDGGSDCYVFDTCYDKVKIERDDNVRAIASYNGELYDAGEEKKIFNTFTNVDVLELPGDIYCLHEHYGKLLNAGNYPYISDLDGNNLYDLRDSDLMFPIMSMFTFMDQIYVIDRLDTIYLPSRRNVIRENCNWSSVITVPRKYLGGKI